MGFRSSLLITAPLLLAAPALAQQDSGGNGIFSLPQSQPPPATDKQGPEIDTFRGAPAPVTPPPIVVPTIEIPPPVTPARRTATPQIPAAAPARPAEPERTPEQVTPATAQPSAAEPVTQAAEPAPPPVDSAVSPAVGNAAEATPEPAPSEPSIAPTATYWPWIAAAVALLLAIAFFALRRRKPEGEYEGAEDVGAEDASEAPAEPLAPARPSPTPPSAPRPAATPTKAQPAPAPASADRPWLDIDLTIEAARLTLVGATIGYRLTIHNRGNREAEEILIRSLIANADAQQQALFQSFFAGDTGLPVHSVTAIGPGATQTLRGETRLDAQAIEAIRLGNRALLIPVIAFDAQYRWSGESEGVGRTGRAFIVGEEQSPPVDRLAPFRLDLGPRQYPAPGCRATALSLAS